jgi:hypothetical protein
MQPETRAAEFDVEAARRMLGMYLRHARRISGCRSSASNALLRQVLRPTGSPVRSCACPSPSVCADTAASSAVRR